VFCAVGGECCYVKASRKQLSCGVSSYQAELAKKETTLVALQQDMSSLSDRYSEQQKQMEDNMRSQCAAAECECVHDTL